MGEFSFTYWCIRTVISVRLACGLYVHYTLSVCLLIHTRFSSLSLPFSRSRMGDGGGGGVDGRK